MQGTGGLRKARFAPPSWHRRKSGAMRVCYAVRAEYGLVFLVALFAKNKQANLTASERRAAKDLLDEIDLTLREGSKP